MPSRGQPDRLARILANGYGIRSIVQLSFLQRAHFGDGELALLEHGRMPDEGWDELAIESFLLKFAQADVRIDACSARYGSGGCHSAGRHQRAGVGEREGRVLCQLVDRRHWRMAHGVGRSGSLRDWQPKAAGSSLLHALVVRLARDFVVRVLQWPVFGRAGTGDGRGNGPDDGPGNGPGNLGPARVRAECVAVLPVCTGMALFFTLRALEQLHRRRHPAAGPRGTVVWLRADQKSALKAIELGGWRLVVVEPVAKYAHADDGCEGRLLGLFTDLDALAHALKLVTSDASNFVCVLSTTSCFAPRACDDLCGVGTLCAAHGAYHVANNAYGLCSASICALIRQAARTRHLHAAVQSTDKNFLVPVGGSLVYAPNPSLADVLTALWPGRASASPIVDILAGLLCMGVRGWARLRAQREQAYGRLRANLLGDPRFAGRIAGCAPSGTDISLALFIDARLGIADEQVRLLGPRLFARGFSGMRTVAQGRDELSIQAHHRPDAATGSLVEHTVLSNWQAHCSRLYRPDQADTRDDGATYLTVAAGLGMCVCEADCFADALCGLLQASL